MRDFQEEKIKKISKDHNNKEIIFIIIFNNKKLIKL